MLEMSFRMFFENTGAFLLARFQWIEETHLSTALMDRGLSVREYFLTNRALLRSRSSVGIACRA
jgi:hypothetical protein